VKRILFILAPCVLVGISANVAEAATQQCPAPTTIENWTDTQTQDDVQTGPYYHPLTWQYLGVWSLRNGDLRLYHGPKFTPQGAEFYVEKDALGNVTGTCYFGDNSNPNDNDADDTGDVMVQDDGGNPVVLSNNGQ